MSTLGEDLKAARERLRQARDQAKSALDENGAVTSLVISEIAKLEEETKAMRDEITGLNGGPV